MKLKNGLIFSTLEGQTVVVAAGEAGEGFKGMMKMNETAAFLAKLMQNEQTEDALTEALLEIYDVTPDVARRNVRYVVKQLGDLGLLE